MKISPKGRYARQAMSLLARGNGQDAIRSRAQRVKSLRCLALYW